MDVYSVHYNILLHRMLTVKHINTHETLQHGNKVGKEAGACDP